PRLRPAARADPGGAVGSLAHLPPVPGGPRPGAGRPLPSHHATARPAASARGRAGCSGVLEPETDLQTDLDVRDPALGELAADLGDLEPVEVAQGLRGSADAVADGLDHALRRGADDLGD